jgi:hypothetical protein
MFAEISKRLESLLFHVYKLTRKDVESRGDATVF